ncbi:MAG: ZIP family metal transporter [Chitinophagales bacterium]
MSGWLEALLYGGLSGYSLLGGGLFTRVLKLGRRGVAMIMAFGSGVLIASLSYGLMEEAYHHGGLDAGAFGLIGGATLYYAAHGAVFRHRRFTGSHLTAETTAGQTGRAVVTGAVLDGLPEQFALGVGVKLGSHLGFLVMAAILLSNFAEAVVATPDLTKQRGVARTLGLWAIIGTLSTAASLLGFWAAERVGGDVLGFLLAFAAGAVLAMLADTLLPEAFRGGGRLTSLATTAGFLVAFMLARS